MTIPLEQARSVLKDFTASRIENLFAQAHAKHVLHEVKESPENFPAFDERLDDKVTFAAYALLASSCSMIEHQSYTEGFDALEKAATLLQNIHGPFVEISRESGFHVLVSSMAFYAAGHYSRAFVTIQNVESQTAAARIIAAFIRKDIKTLIQRLNEVLLRNTPAFEDQTDLDEWVVTVAIARSLAMALEYLYTGTRDFIDAADRQLEDAAIVASTGHFPAYWWTVRLLKLMLGNLGDASLWQILPPFFDPETKSTLARYIRLMAYSRPPVVELWASQRAALPMALNTTNRGGVVNLRTSAGKTRIAELAILQTLASDSSAQIIYLAPFRSLAMEVEQTLAASFSWLGFKVSHLYGGSRVSSVDTELAAESSIMIATPEKTRALFRAAPDLFENVKLIIVDEGHLIGPSERFVKNELFVDHLRSLARTSSARILLLSAVLPNPQELAEWVTGDSDAVATSRWKPSVERYGLLRWNGSRVRIDWLGDVESFNPSFAEAKPLSDRKNSRLFPRNKTEAIAASAVRLSRLGPVMIFAGQAQWVPSMARAVLLALGESSEEHPWPEHEWKVFKAVCEEELIPDAIEIRAAEVGVICHSNRLTPQVRLALEHLMRAYPPKIIIATTTLGQGVNVGISSVVVATPYIGNNKTINKRDFWNICGRAGRAFVDGEGKILYAIDETRSRQKIRKDKKLARYYFDTTIRDRIESGLLFVVNLLRQIAARAGVSFEVLLELVANNDFSRLGESSESCEKILDLLDDELLALHGDPVVNPSGEDPAVWVDQVFRDSLAVIQARSELAQSSEEDVINFLKARAASAVRRVPDPSTRKAIVSSGLPLSVAIRAHEDLEFFRGVADSFIQSDQSLSSLATTVRQIEEWVRTNASSITKTICEESRLGALREGWLGGIGLRELITRDDEANLICKDFYGYQLSWIIHAVSQTLQNTAEEERAEIFARISLLVELGVPTELAARIFLAGIRSRSAATELASLDVAYGTSVSAISSKLRESDFIKPLLSKVTQPTAEWLNLLLADMSRRRGIVPTFPSFKLRNSEKVDCLFARRIGEQIFLCTADGRTRFRIKSSKRFPFVKIANDPRMVFERSDDIWHLVFRDPRLEQ